MNQTQNSSTYRKERLAGAVLRLLSPAIREIGEDQGFVASVSDVTISDIRKGAQVWLSVISGDGQKFLQLTRKQKWMLEGKVFTSLPLPFKLNLEFYLDEGAKQAQHIAELLK